jgi:hypothetical protein
MSQTLLLPMVLSLALMGGSHASVALSTGGHHEGRDFAKHAVSPLNDTSGKARAKEMLSLPGAKACLRDAKACQSSDEHALREFTKQASALRHASSASFQDAKPDLTAFPDDVTHCDSVQCTLVDARATPPIDLQPLTAFMGLLETTQGFDGARVLTGELFHCRDYTVNYSHCCAKATGWGQTAHLTHCHANEKVLAEKRAARVCIAVGERCQHHALGQCTQHEKS